MSVGSWSFPSTSTVTGSSGTQETVGVQYNDRTWTGGDSRVVALRDDPVSRKILKWKAIGIDLAYLTEKQAAAYLRAYARAHVPPPKGSSPRVIADFNRSLSAPGLLGRSLAIRNGGAPGTSPATPHVKRARFGSENAYTSTRRYLKGEMISYTLVGFPRYNSTLGMIFYSAPSDLLGANGDIKAIDKLKGVLRGSDFNLSVMLGEGHQTLRMIGDTALKIATAGYLVKHGEIRAAAKVLTGSAKLPPRGGPKALHPSWFNRPGADARGVVANNWLELQYGWLPLLGDLDDAAKLLAHQLNVPFRQSYRTTVRKTQHENVAFGGGVINTTLTRQSFIGLVAKMKENPNSIPALTGVLDPELVAWELVPFSFVADWFIPIGSYLSARAEASRLKGTFVTTKINSSRWSATVVGTAPKTGKGPNHWTQISRTVSTSLAVPLPALKTFEQAASWQHCANALALVAQVFTGNKPWSK